MKKVLLTALCVVGLASVAQAGKTVYHDYNQVLGTGAEGIALDNACVTDSQVKTIRPVKICTNLVPVKVNGPDEFGGHTDWVCQSYEVTALVRDRAFTRVVCSKSAPVNEYQNGQCLEWSDKADFLPDTIKTSVVTEGNGDGNSDFPGRASSFTFPRCAQAN